MIIGKVLIQGATQLVELPPAAEFPNGVTEVTIRLNGPDRILSPANKSWESFFLQGPAVSEDFMPE